MATPPTRGELGAKSTAASGTKGAKPPNAPKEGKISATLQALGQRVKEARLVRRMTLAELASSASIGVSTLQAIEAGAAGVSVGNLARVMQAMGLHEQWTLLLDPQRDSEFVRYAQSHLPK